MLRSLRVRLVVSYSLLALLCLATAGGAVAFLLRDYQREIVINRLADLLVPIAVQARDMERLGMTDDQTLVAFQEQARDLQVRVLVVDANSIVTVDTDSTLVGSRIALPNSRLADPRPIVRWAQLELSNGERWLLVGTVLRPRSPVPGFGPLPPISSSPTPGFGPLQQSPSMILLAAREPDALSGLAALAPSIWPAAVISLVASIAVGLLLSQTIARPVADLTRAAEAMGRGDYGQEIPVRSEDELGRLARTFNEMAKQVAASDRAMRDFLANVSHDLRTPLTSIRGFAEAIADGTAKGPEVGEVARIIASEADHLNKLVEQVLTLSKLESGQIQMTKQPFELAAIVEGCASRFQRQADARSISLTVKTEPASIIGDPLRIEQVVTNLLDNAVKFTPSGGAITVTLHRTGDSNGIAPRQPTVKLRVHNTGSTIAAEDLPRVFERFYQADRSRSHRADGQAGSGLGLAIVREIVLAHGGQVRGTSDADGTAFEVLLSTA